MCYWASLNIESNRIESSEESVLSALRGKVQLAQGERDGMKKQIVVEAKRDLALCCAARYGLATAIVRRETRPRTKSESPGRLQASELARENLSRVAASAGEIKPVLAQR